MMLSKLVSMALCLSGEDGGYLPLSTVVGGIMIHENEDDP